MTRTCSAVFPKAKAAETNIERDDDIADFMTLYFLCAGRRLDPGVAGNGRHWLFAQPLLRGSIEVVVDPWMSW